MMILSPNIPHVGDSFHLGTSRLDSGPTLSKSTPDLNSLMATQAEINAKESEVAREAKKEKVQQLKTRREQLQLKLAEKLLELRILCLKEAEITGVLPAELPDIPGQPPPTVSKRIGTEFSLPSKFLEKDIIRTNDAIEKLELEIEIQRQKTNAARKLSEDKTLSKSARRHHHVEYLSQSEKLKQLKETLTIYLEERGQGKITLSKTTDDVDSKSTLKGEDSGQTCYRTLPNPHKRRPVTPQPQRNSSTNSTVPTNKMPQTISDSMIDSSSLSSNSSSLHSSGHERQVAHRTNSSGVLPHGYTQPTNGGRLNVLQPLPVGSQQRLKGSSVSPSSTDSYDLASSCSGSLNSLPLNSGADRDSGAPYPYQEPSPASYHDSAGDYSSYLRNMQKAYFAPSGRYACGSLDRKKLVRKHSSNATNPDSALQVVELAELIPSKFGSKRESAVDSRDSSYNYEDTIPVERAFGHHYYQGQNYRESGGSSYAPPFDRLQESNNEPSRIQNNDVRYKPFADETRRMQFQSGSSNRSVQNSGSFSSQDPRNWSIYSDLPSEMSDINEYIESLRSAQQKRRELSGIKAMPAPSPDVWLQQMVQRKRTKNPAGQSSRTMNRKSPLNADSESDAVDALFKHNDQRAHVNAFEQCRGNSIGTAGSLQQCGSHLPNYKHVNSSSSSSFPSTTSVPQSLRFVKVNSNDQTQGSSSGIQESISSPSLPYHSHTPNPLEINGCSTLV